jgi:putative transposase
MCPPGRYAEVGRLIMSKFRRLSHTIYECKYHIVFCPKYRYSILDGNVGEYAKQQVYHLARQKDLVDGEEIKVQADHIHTILSIPPKYSISGIVGFLKGKMAQICSIDMSDLGSATLEAISEERLTCLLG